MKREIPLFKTFLSNFRLLYDVCFFQINIEIYSMVSISCHSFVLLRTNVNHNLLPPCIFGTISLLLDGVLRPLDILPLTFLLNYRIDIGTTINRSRYWEGVSNGYLFDSKNLGKKILLIDDIDWIRSKL